MSIIAPTPAAEKSNFIQRVKAGPHRRWGLFGDTSSCWGCLTSGPSCQPQLVRSHRIPPVASSNFQCWAQGHIVICSLIPEPIQPEPMHGLSPARGLIKRQPTDSKRRGNNHKSNCPIYSPGRSRLAQSSLRPGPTQQCPHSRTPRPRASGTQPPTTPTGRRTPPRRCRGSSST